MPSARSTATIIPYPESYAVIEAAIGLGNLVGGFVVGAIGARLRKGWLVITGFAVMGLATIALGLTSNELLAVGAAVVIGIFNLVYVIPSQTLFAERTPEGMMGRVVAIRSSIVMGALTGAMAVSCWPGRPHRRRPDHRLHGRAHRDGGGHRGVAAGGA